MKKILCLMLALLACMLLVFTSCGDDETSSSSTPAPGPTPSATVTDEQMKATIASKFNGKKILDIFNSTASSVVKTEDIAKFFNLNKNLNANVSVAGNAMLGAEGATVISKDNQLYIGAMGEDLYIILKDNVLYAVEARAEGGFTSEKIMDLNDLTAAGSMMEEIPESIKNLLETYTLPEIKAEHLIKDGEFFVLTSDYLNAAVTDVVNKLVAAEALDQETADQILIAAPSMITNAGIKIGCKANATEITAVKLAVNVNKTLAASMGLELNDGETVSAEFVMEAADDKATMTVKANVPGIVNANVSLTVDANAKMAASVDMTLTAVELGGNSNSNNGITTKDSVEADIKIAGTATLDLANIFGAATAKPVEVNATVTVSNNKLYRTTTDYTGEEVEETKVELTSTDNEYLNAQLTKKGGTIAITSVNDGAGKTDINAVIDLDIAGEKMELTLTGKLTDETTYAKKFTQVDKLFDGAAYSKYSSALYQYAVGYMYSEEITETFRCVYDAGNGIKVVAEITPCLDSEGNVTGYQNSTDFVVYGGSYTGVNVTSADLQEYLDMMEEAWG